MSDVQELIAKAEKKAKPSSGFFSFLGGSDSYRYEEAADLFVEAANLYRLRKELDKAGDTFLRAAECQVKATNEDEAGNTYIEAYKCFKTGSSPSQAAESLSKSIDIFTRRGQFRRGANFKFELAELQEQQLQDFPSAIDNYEIAGDWYLQDQAVALSNKSFIKCADLKALNGDYLEATEILKKVVENSLGNKLSQWSLKEYLLKIGLCYLAAGDVVAADKSLNESQSLDSSFSQSREFELLSNLIEAVREGDPDKLSQKIYEYDRFNKLDHWKTTVLLKVKNTIVEADDDLL
ncbi:unnamed protein product [Kluyveromyces dobzhanskii CBS 2104]|uniref:WGS project CCBQ000000000 data, contig 00106 n=1 Tax=Kluyveromyces dobzhanskii CBS 2104 TaxID=1427455 RepID=A0A0A8L5N5_9SACH|nr:unnamed protein product [Kluyveromyces dobzhanskii CBS 2104]